MSTLSALGARALPASLYANHPQADGKANAAGTAAKPADLATDPVDLSSGGIDLQQRLDSVGNQTVDYAQNLLGSFAQSLFGDAAKGATISFDSASLEAQSSFAVGVQHTEGSGGTTDAAALQLSDSSHFLGKGTITTADGRKFDFEVEVQYSDQLTASASQTQSGGPAPVPANAAHGAAPDGSDNGGGNDSGGPSNASGDTSLPTVVFPNIDFPGTLGDLFKLIGHNLEATLSTQNGDKNQGHSIDRTALRSLSLRLLSLVDHKSSDTYSPNAKAKSVAQAYGATPAAPADASGAVTAPAPTSTDTGTSAADASATPPAADNGS